MVEYLQASGASVENEDMDDENDENVEEVHEPLSDEMVNLLLDTALPSSREISKCFDRPLLQSLIKELRPVLDPSLITEQDRKLEQGQAVESLDSFFVCTVCDYVVREPLSCSQCEKAFCKECS